MTARHRSAECDDTDWQLPALGDETDRSIVPPGRNVDLPADLEAGAQRTVTGKRKKRR